MIPVSLRLRNFLSYRESAPPLDFTGFRLACLSGPNGHGKSALLDAMTWALWGQARKSAGSVKPEAGLLHIGASEMKVEFAFELSGERYQVTRSYQVRRGGTEKRDLQLHVWDPDAREYLSLTQKRASDTQALITQLLRMDYETFINSSFLLQGRADEFTCKKPPERKAILAEILGLSRYDQLQELARQQVRVLERTLIAAKSEQDSLERELTTRPGLERELKEAQEALQSVDTERKKWDEQLQQLTRRRQQLEKLQFQQQSEQSQLQSLQSELAGHETRLQSLTNRLAELREVLSNSAAIESRWAYWQELDRRLRELSQAAQRHLSLERRRGELLSAIQQEQSLLEQERVRLQERRDALLRDLEQARQLLARRADIESRVTEYETVSCRVAGLEQQQQRQQRLERDLVAVRSAIEAQRSRLEVEKARLEAELGTLRQRIARAEELTERFQQTQERLQHFAALAESQERLKESGQQLKSQKELLEREIKELQAQLEQEREKLLLLERSEEPVCPVCKSELDEPHRRELVSQIQNTIGRLQLSLQDKGTQLPRVEAALEEHRREFRRLEAQLRGREAAQAEAGKLQGELEEIERCRQQTHALESELRERETQISEHRYAQAERVREQELLRDLQSISFAPEELAVLRKQLERLSLCLVEKQKLEEAQGSVAVLTAEQECMDAALESVRLRLSQESYAPGLRSELQQIEGEIQRLGYDPEEHRRMEDEREALAGVAAEKSRLDSCRAQWPEQERQHRETESAIAQCQGKIQEMQRSLQSLLPRLQELPQVLKDLSQMQQQCQILAERSHELQGQLKFLRHKLQDLEQKERRRRELSMQFVRDSEEQKQYEILADAFGPKGVQALIIENVIPEIQQEANRLLERLTGNRTRVSLESLREKKSGGAIETLDIKISDELGTRDYELYSGGEAFRINLAIRLALSRLLARRAGASLRTLVIDEGFGTQDAEGLESIVQVIREISEEFEKILVVTHLESLKDAFPTRIEVIKHPDKGSVFEVIHS